MDKSERKQTYYKRLNVICKSSLFQLFQSLCYIFYVSNNFHSYVSFFLQIFCIAILFVLIFFRIASSLKCMANCEIRYVNSKPVSDYYTDACC